jgi:hypothetical protein
MLIDVYVDDGNREGMPAKNKIRGDKRSPHLVFSALYLSGNARCLYVCKGYGKDSFLGQPYDMLGTVSDLTGKGEACLHHV